MWHMHGLTYTPDAYALARTPKPSPDLHQERRFGCFLSHFKQEAGTEARLVKQMLAPHIKKDLFLDSGKACLV